MEKRWEKQCSICGQTRDVLTELISVAGGHVCRNTMCKDRAQLALLGGSDFADIDEDRFYEGEDGWVPFDWNKIKVQNDLNTCENCKTSYVLAEDHLEYIKELCKEDDGVVKTSVICPKCKTVSLIESYPDMVSQEIDNEWEIITYIQCMNSSHHVNNTHLFTAIKEEE